MTTNTAKQFIDLIVQAFTKFNKFFIIYKIIKFGTNQTRLYFLIKKFSLRLILKPF